MSIDRILAAGLPATARPIVERWARVLQTREEDVISTILVVQDRIGGEITADGWASAAETLEHFDDAAFAQTMAVFVVEGLGDLEAEDATAWTCDQPDDHAGAALDAVAHRGASLLALDGLGCSR